VKAGNWLACSLYIPASRVDLEDAIARANATPCLSVILCAEDAIPMESVDAAMANFRGLLQRLSGYPSLKVFIRPRSPSMLDDILRIDGCENVAGFVLPKSDMASLPGYLDILAPTRYLLMPTLETAAIFEQGEVLSIRKLLSSPSVREKVAAIRIGGNDLLGALRLKRVRGATIYETPLVCVIPRLVIAFRPHGFRLTGVVFDDFSDHVLLRVEARRDKLMGLVGKTAIHPSQVSIIQSEMAVSPDEVVAAELIRENSLAGAFGHNGMMIEPAVHSPWSDAVLSDRLLSDVAAGPAGGSNSRSVKIEGDT
jgi:citrate lyase beta subunit